MGIRESIQTLQLNAHNFANKTVRQAEQFSEPSFPQLTELLEKMNKVTAARKPFCPEEYIGYWIRYQRQQIAEIPRRVQRFLCWEPGIGADLSFLLYLKSLNDPQGANALQGLVYARHSAWTTENQTEELKLVRSAILKFEGRNRLLKKWQENLHLILDSRSPKLAAEKMFSGYTPVAAFCEEWGINEQTAFVSKVVSECAALCFQMFDESESDRELDTYFVDYILSWKNFQLNDYKSLISKTILTDKFLGDEKFQEKIVGQVLDDKRLGDPRLPVNSQNWVGIDQEARTRILKLLSRADIVFFFDQVMTGYDDRHGRKDFWLQYVNSLKQSRPLLNGTDKYRLYHVLRRQGKSLLHFGETRGQQSAFMLDFGSILVIEFNGVGACYIYEEIGRKRIFYDFYTDESYTDGVLKQPDYAAERVSHRGDWQWRLSYILSQYGIRPS